MKPPRFACLLLCGTTGLLAEPNASTHDFLSAKGLDAFQPTSAWCRVADASAVDGKNEIRTQGEGTILVNGLTKDKSIPYLHTREAFGDVRVELEFMTPKGSNAGVYLMGRYEIQIFDSFGKAKVGSADLGGLYARWDKTQPKDRQWTEGSAPKANAATAPGTWQTMDIVFRAPRFDAKGQKTRDAMFESVHVNGVLVQENASTSGGTASHPLPGEASSGPIAIQGDHGPIAIRRFRATALPSPDTSAREELDAYWAKVSRTVSEGDFAAYQETCHEQGVIISGTKQSCYPLRQALARWQTDFDRTRAGEVKSSVDFRFAHRYRDATTAHESGVFRYTATEAGAEPVTTYTAFEALLTRQDGNWKILMEHQKGTATESDWNALAPGRGPDGD